jgi:transcription-repair coupling factor (superfamily II helicase)
VTTPPGSLAALPPLLRNEPGLTTAFGDPQAVVAVPEAARAMAIAALGQLSGRRPLLVACPTGNDAGQLYDDLRQYVGAGPTALGATTAEDVMLFPAWETLPFERVSPSVETMGRRLEVLWRPADAGALPRDRRHRRTRAAPEARAWRAERRADLRPTPATSSTQTTS